MTSAQAFLFRLLWNITFQAALFAFVAVAVGPLIRRLRAKQEHVFFLGVLLLCLFAPITDTLRHAEPHSAASEFAQYASVSSATAPRSWWDLSTTPALHISASIPIGLQDIAIAGWALFVLYRLLRFALSLQKMRRLRRNAMPLRSAARAALPFWLSGLVHRVQLLESQAITTPMTVGILQPAIVLPSRLLPAMPGDDLAAAVAHEYAHIRRRDFLTHLFAEIVTLPVSWHPGIRYLSSRVSQTRELACDEDAAAHFGRRRIYTQSLLRLASLCLRLQSGDTMALSIFDGDNLEERIMKLTEKKIPLTRMALLSLVLLLSFAFGSSALLARATSLQATPAVASQSFGGTWNWMFKGRAFTTMKLVPHSAGYSGTVTESHVALDDQGYLSKADPAEDGGIATVTKTAMEGDALRVTLSDGFEFTVTLKDDTHAEIHPVGAPAIMKPVQAVKVQ